jgi:hypothetical protein
MPIKPPYIDRQGYQYSPEVQAKIDAAIHAKAIELSQGYEPKPEPMKSIGYEVTAVSEDEKPELIAGKFAPTFDARNYSGTLREILIFRVNQLSLVNDANDFWQAQSEVNTLRNKLQTAYNSAVQKAQMRHGFKARKSPSETMAEPLSAIEYPEIWTFSAAAYDLITEQGMRLADVVNMSGAKLAQLAIEQGNLFKEKAEKEGDTVYMIAKKSREK